VVGRVAASPGDAAAPRCKICQGACDAIGEKHGSFAKRDFRLVRCRDCQFAFVADPWLDFAAIYDSAYYEGRGADPSVDYHFELAEPERAIRRYEWAGVLRVVSRLTALGPQTRWLDYGCGNGGLVRHARKAAGCDAVGYEEGAIAASAKEAGIPIVGRAQLAGLAGSFDVVTAIEVLEHVVEPLEALTEIRRLLRPGGVFFYTTGNARPVRQRLLAWQYFCPEIHISLYEPDSMREALRRTGFEARDLGYVAGWDEIIAFKILKNLGLRRARRWQRAVPWRALAPLVNRRYGPYDFPVAFAPA
jgi:SAM-dependent methyltransferase